MKYSTEEEIESLEDAFPSVWTEMVGTRLHGKKTNWILTADDIRLLDGLSNDEFIRYIHSLRNK